MDMQGSDPIDGTEADVADVLDQLEPPRSEPIEEVLGERDAVDGADPELTGLEGEEAEDSGQS